ncbi:hypothetical protein ACC685_36455, partial [Rhizobium ruizarguesonis]
MAEWERVKSGEIAVDGGWRIYSSGPGLYIRSFVENILGFKRRFGRRKRKPLLPAIHASAERKRHAARMRREHHAIFAAISDRDEPDARRAIRS